MGPLPAGPQATTPQLAATTRERQRRPGQPHGAVTSRASTTARAFAGKTCPIDVQTTTHHQPQRQRLRRRRRRPTARTRRSGHEPDETDRQDEKRQDRLLDEDDDAQQHAGRRPAARGRSPGEQESRPRGGLGKVDAQRGRSRQTRGVATRAMAVPTAPPGPAASQARRTAPEAEQRQDDATMRAPARGSPPTSRLPGQGDAVYGGPQQVRPPLGVTAPCPSRIDRPTNR